MVGYIKMEQLQNEYENWISRDFELQVRQTNIKCLVFKFYLKHGLKYNKIFWTILNI